MVLIILVLFGILLLPQYVPSQPRNLNFERLTIQQGLPALSVNCTFSDKEGFMWFGTNEGLIRFDGYDYKTFKASPEKESLSNNWVHCLYEDSKGNLWLGTQDGLNKFIKDNENFITYRNNPNEPASISKNSINCIFEDKAGILWVGTRDGGLNRFDGEKFTAFMHNPNDSNSISDIDVRCIYEDYEGNLWIGTSRSGLDKFDKKNKFTHYGNNLQNLTPISGNAVWCLFGDKKRNLWIGTTNGLGKLNLNEVNGDADKKISRYFYNPPKFVLSISEDEYGLLWLATQGSVVVLDPESENFSEYKSNPDNPHSPVGYYFSSIYKDKTGIIWISSGVGISYYAAYRTSFNHYFNDIVFALSTDKYDNLYMGTGKSGLYVTDSRRENTRRILYDENPPSVSSYNAVACINSIFRDTLLISFETDLYKYDVNTGTFSNYKDFSGRNRVQDILVDHEGLIWLGTMDRILVFRLSESPMKNIASLKHKNNDPSSLSEGWVNKLFEDKSGIIWAGTTSGLNRIVVTRITDSSQSKQRLDLQITHYNYDRNDTNSISGDYITSIYEDEQGYLWVGTQSGLNKLDKNLNKFTRYTVNNGMLDNSVQGILHDNSGNLWLSTQKGICKLSTKTETFKNYDKTDGLPNTFNERACCRSKSGELFFGSENGVISFFPDSIKKNPNVPPIAITSFKLFNKEISLSKVITETNEIRLSYKDNFFSFEFSALDYTNPSKNQYAYMLENIDKDWVKTTASKREASYTDIDPGEYMFRVKGSNNDGVWNETGKSIKIIITPPWWRTWWFTACSILLAAGIFGGTIRYVSVQKLKRRLELEQERARISKDMHDEVGSSLTRITLLSEVARKKLGDSEEIKRISDASRDVVNNMDEIVWAVNPKNDTLDNLAAYVLQYAQEFFGATGTSCRFDYPQTIPYIALSSEVRHNIFLVIKEAINNIVKHSEASETVIKLTVNPSSFEFSVADNGKGFDEEKRDRFSNGISNMQKRITDIKGEVEIKSGQGLGTKIRIIVPV